MSLGLLPSSSSRQVTFFFSRKYGPCLILAFAGYEFGHRDRRSRLEPHREA